MLIRKLPIVDCCFYLLQKQTKEQTKKEVRVVSPSQTDELRSHCTEDDIAEQRGLLPGAATEKQVVINVNNQPIKPGTTRLICFSEVVFSFCRRR